MKVLSFENVNMNDSKYKNMKILYNRSKFGWYWAPLFVSFWFLLFYLVVRPSYHYYPRTITEGEEHLKPGSFIGERAEKMLLRLSKIGPKVVGSAANEQAAVSFLLSEIGEIQEKVNTTLFDFEQDVQIASGNYELWEMINMYQSIQNVVVKLTPKGSNSSASLLINSHYDSVPGSSGAGDSGMMIVVMLETLRAIATHKTPLTHSIVFLFNGAEENPLQGSHAFITQHRWAKNVRAVMNLDSAGSGGREILFQSGPDHPWLMNYYGAHIKHPYASTIAEEMFQNGFVPSETDFRIFRDFGKIPGLDMAHSLNGYVYHTKYDRFNLIPRRTYQLTGNNVLSLAKALANAPELEDSEKYAKGHTVFFDVLGWFIVYYSETTGIIINITVCVMAIATILVYIWNMAHQTGMFRRRIFVKFGILLAIQLVTVILALSLTMTIAVIIDSSGRSMAWYSNSWLVFGLYFCPMFFTMGIFQATYLSETKERGLALGYAVQLIMHAHCLILTLVTIIMICFGIRSAFVIMLCIGFYTLSVILNIITSFHKSTFNWLIPHCICQILPYLFYTYLCYAFYITFIPMQGRDGVDSNPEFLIGGFTALMCLLFAPFLIPLLCLFRKAKTIISIFGVLTVIFLILATTSVGFPYTKEKAPQRFYAVHTTRTFHARDLEHTVRLRESGFYVVPVDHHPESIDFMFDQNGLTKSTEDTCSMYLLCGFPIYSSRWLGWLKNSFWVPSSATHPGGWPTLKVLSKTPLLRQRTIYTLEVAGPDHMSIFIKPLQNSKLVNWSFEREPLQKFKPPFFISYSYALDPTPLRFHLEFDRGSLDEVSPLFEIAIMGHKVHDDISIKSEFRDFLNKFPAWASVSSWTGSYDLWEI